MQWRVRVHQRACAHARACVLVRVARARSLTGAAAVCLTRGGFGAVCRDASVRVWGARHGAERSTRPARETVLSGHTRTVDMLAWHPTDGSVLASTTTDKTVRVWDAGTRKCTATIKLEGCAGPLNVAWAPGGGELCVGTMADELIFIDAHEKKVTRKVEFGDKFQVNEFTWSRDGKLMYLTTDEGVEVLHYPSLERAHTLRGHTGTCYCLALDRAGTRLAVGSADALVSVWDLDEYVCVATYAGATSQVRSVSFSADGAHVAAGSEDHSIAVFDAATGESAYVLATGAGVNCVSFSPADRLMAIALEAESAAVRVYGHAEAQPPPPKARQSQAPQAHASNAPHASHAPQHAQPRAHQHAHAPQHAPRAHGQPILDARAMPFTPNPSLPAPGHNIHMPPQMQQGPPGRLLVGQGPPPNMPPPQQWQRGRPPMPGGIPGRY